MTNPTEALEYYRDKPADTDAMKFDGEKVRLDLIPVTPRKNTVNATGRKVLRGAVVTPPLCDISSRGGLARQTTRKRA